MAHGYCGNCHINHVMYMQFEVLVTIRNEIVKLHNYINHVRIQYYIFHCLRIILMIKCNDYEMIPRILQL